MKDDRRNELPEDCWELILIRLVLDDDYRDLQSPSLVCKQFLSITDRLRHKMVAGNWVFYRNSCEALRRALQRFPNLKEIELYGRSGCGRKVNIHSAISEIASSGLDLRALVLFRLQNPPSANSLGKLGSTMMNLKLLRCESEPFRDQDLVAIADALPRLEELDISRHAILSKTVVTDAGIEVISRKLLGLRKIDISGYYGCSDRSLIALSSNCVRLQEIRCTGCRVTDRGICFVLSHSLDLIYLRAEYRKWSGDSSFAFDDPKNYRRALPVLDLRLMCM